MSSQKPRLNLLSASRRILPIVLVLLLTAACSKVADKGRSKKRRPQPMVKTALATVKTLTERLELTGSIEPTRFARMASPVAGPVIACPVREGDRVRARQLVARLGRKDGDDAVAASAQAELDREELELGRIEKLVKSGALPGEELDKVRVKVSEARAKLARATEKLGDYRISAPWSGVVSRVHAAVGDFVSAQASLVELFDPASLVLRFAVPESSAARVRDGASITVLLDAHPGRVLAAKVTRIYPEIDRRTHMRIIEGSIESGEADVALAPGMFARLQLTLGSVPETLTVPIESVVRRNGKAIIFVIASDKTAEQRLVELGMQVNGQVQILAGVKKGEAVAVAGHTRLKNGKKVRVAKGFKVQTDKTQKGKDSPESARAKRKAR